ncbi:M23 family metallopeptidase [Nitrobacter sp. Nb-311A]|uniref:M23 family metallopeptidase n=1 Tax=Nitrobacter sp. Nb-311A TaxID=314253 RepID=UPI0002DB2BC1|nr:M23 family metallopeptidase [Nitrobacter sp. Nb-311A]
MSYRSSQFAEYPPHHAHHHHPSRHATAAGLSSRTKGKRSGYTFAHGGRQVRFGPVVFWIAVGTVTLLGIWSAATATYFAFRDDVLTRLIARQADMQYAYEDRIAALRSQVDRTTSRQLLDQEQFERKLDELMRRQTVLESRAGALNALSEVSVTGSIRGSVRKAGRDADAGSAQSGKPSPINDTATSEAPPDRNAPFDFRQPANNRPKPVPLTNVTGDTNRLMQLESSLDQVEGRQIAELNSIADGMDSRLRRMRGVFSDLGLNVAKMAAGTLYPGTGGPYVPVKLRSDSGPFERQLHRINLTRAQIDRLDRALALVPYRKPVVGELEFTSGFGVRVDPFVGRPAMHTGLDFRATTGDSVRATANGKVIAANWTGGYGRMVEVNHGNGLSTRYGHLSAINVKVGQSVKAGQVVGEVGSTGRSTGPHLHYETRIEGDAVDPQKFLRAGARLNNG